jgi:hypothetical protein
VEFEKATLKLVNSVMMELMTLSDVSSITGSIGRNVVVSLKVSGQNRVALR